MRIKIYITIQSYTKKYSTCEFRMCMKCFCVLYTLRRVGYHDGMKTIPLYVLHKFMPPNIENVMWQGMYEWWKYLSQTCLVPELVESSLTVTQLKLLWPPLKTSVNNQPQACFPSIELTDVFWLTFKTSGMCRMNWCSRTPIQLFITSWFSSLFIGWQLCVEAKLCAISLSHATTVCGMRTYSSIWAT